MGFTQDLRVAPGQTRASGSSPLVYFIILNYNGAQITLDCLHSLMRVGYPNFRVVIVDNASTDDSVTQLRTALSDPRVEILVNEKNEGYAGGNNRGMKKALGAGADYVFVLNNDTIVEPGCLAPLVDVMERDPKIGPCGCPIIDIGHESDPNLGQRVNMFTAVASHWRHRGDVRGPVEVDYICGAAIMFRADMLRRIGMFDERFLLVCEDSDICFRARKAGYRVCFVPGPGVRHLMSQTVKRHRPLMAFLETRNAVWFIRRHGRLKHLVLFDIIGLLYFYPKAILGRLYRREFHLLRPILRGIWQGHTEDPGFLGHTTTSQGRGA